MAGPMRWTRGLPTVALLTIVLLAPGCIAQGPPEGPSGIHLAYGQDASSTVIVQWLGPPGAQATVEYGTDEGYGEEVPGEQTVPPASSRVAYHAELDGLAADTTYHYRVVVDGQASEDRTFTTAPPPGEPAELRLTAYGDQGTAHPANTRADDQAPAEVLALAKEQAPTFHLHAGDLSYAEGDGTQWNAYLDQIEPLASKTPYMTVAGNHEREAGLGFANYDARFQMPTGEEGRWWSMRYANVLVIGLNSERACQSDDDSLAGLTGDPADDCESSDAIEPYQPQLEWLEATLSQAANDTGIDWRIVLSHHLFWSSSAHQGAKGFQDHYMPVLDRYGVDLVVQGHDHVYERTKVLSGGDLTETGIVYLTSGAAGSGTYDWSGDRPDWTAYRDNEHYGTLVLDLAPDRAQGRFVALDGETLDSFTLANQPGAGVSYTATGTNVSGPSGDGGGTDEAPGPSPLVVAGLVTLAGVLARSRTRSDGS